MKQHLDRILHLDNSSRILLSCQVSKNEIEAEWWYPFVLFLYNNVVFQLSVWISTFIYPNID